MRTAEALATAILDALNALGVADAAAALGVADAVNAGRKLSAISYQPSAIGQEQQRTIKT